EQRKRLRDAVPHRAGLAREPAAADGADHVVLVAPIGDAEGLVDHHAQHRPREVDGDVAAVDRDLAGAGLDPDAGDRVLALARGVGAAEAVEPRLGRLGLGRRRRRRLGAARHYVGESAAAFLGLAHTAALFTFFG